MRSARYYCALQDIMTSLDSIPQPAAAPAASPQPPSSDYWQGQLSLQYTRPDRKTQIQQVKTKAPLRLQRPFYPEGESVCHSVIVHTAGGMVGGDGLNYAIDLQPQSHALLTTSAAHKVYRSQGAIAHQDLHLNLAAGACLEWFPQETIIFNQAHYRQTSRIDLAPDAIWIGWDITRFGRSARGEQFVHGSWRSQLEVWQQQRPLWIDRQHLTPNAKRRQSPHGLANHAVVGSLALVGCTIAPQHIQQARELGANLIQPHDPSSDLGVTRLMQGMICRYRGDSSQAARRWFMAVWNILRPLYARREACIPRVW